MPIVRRAGVLIAAVVASCSFDWASFDPREGGSEGGAPGGGGPGSSASSGGAGGTTSAGGDGGAITTGGAGGVAGDGGVISAGGMGGAGGAPIVSTTYAASIAECIDPLVLDPDDCEADAGAGHLNVDLEDGATASPVQSYLAFPIDGAIAGHSVLDVTLSLTVSADLGSNSNSSGEIWLVSAFSLADLSSAEPTKIGNQPLAADLGSVALSRTVTFTLPPASVAPNTTLYLGIYPLSTNGVNYYNNAGATPPQLSITYQ